MKKSVLILYVIFTVHISFGQQLPHFTQFPELLSYHNPAAVGVFGIHAALAARNQWVGLADSLGNKLGPDSYMLIVDVPINDERNGLGLVGLYDRYGFEESMFVRIQAAQHVRIGRKNTLSVGASLDYQRKTMDFSRFGTPPYTNPGFLYDISETAGAPDASAGILYSHSSGLFLGISAQNILQSYLRYSGFNYRNVRQYQAMAGASIALAKSQAFTLDLLPAFLIKTTELLVPQYDVHAGLLMNKRFYAGLAYRHDDAAALVFGYTLNYFRLGVSYDYTISALGGAGSFGSPELVLSYSRPLRPKSRWEGRCYP